MTREDHKANVGPGIPPTAYPRHQPGETRVILDGVYKTFPTPKGTIEVVQDVSFELREGDFVSFVGPSGCGKTTMLNMIAGFERPDQGTLLFDGQPIAGPGHERGVIFQEYGVFPWLSVRDNILFGLRLKANRLPAKEQAAIADRYIKLMRLDGFEDYYPRALSGGMRQRLALARTYAVNPEVLLMDEPFGALDAQTRLAMQVQLMDLLVSERKTVMLITHSVEEALFLSTRVMMISARPSRVIEELVVPFDYPRDPSIITTPRFQELRGHLQQHLSKQYEEQEALAKGRSL